MEYKRITNTDKRIVLGEPYTTIKDTVLCDSGACNFCAKACPTMVKALDRLYELEDMIERKRLVMIPDNIDIKYAIIRYSFRKNQPFDIVEYVPYMIDMNGEFQYSYCGAKSGNFVIVQDGFVTSEEAEEVLRKLKEE